MLHCRYSRPSLAGSLVLVPLLLAAAPAGPGDKAQGDHRHHGGHHSFQDAAAWAKHFESPERAKWQKPDLVVDLLQHAPTHRVADIGSGTGYFAARIAREVAKGRVWGVDIEPDMVRFLNQRARREKLPNLFSVLGTPADPLLPEQVDRIILVDTYHHIDARVAYFRALRQQLRPGGRLVVVDFKRGDLPVGPPDAMKLSAAQVEAELVQAGYRRHQLEPKLLPYQYVLVMEPAA